VQHELRASGRLLVQRIGGSATGGAVCSCGSAASATAVAAVRPRPLRCHIHSGVEVRFSTAKGGAAEAS
jgi:hypothetical protein